MPPSRAIRALNHSYRQRILRVLKEGPLSYSDLLSSLEPKESERGRFNYHLRAVRDAGLVALEEGFYALTPGGEAGVRMLEELSENPRPPRNRRRSQTMVLALLVVGLLGATTLFAVVFANVLTASPSAAREYGWGSRALVVEIPDRDGGGILVQSSGSGLIMLRSDESGIYGRQLASEEGAGIPTLTSRASSTKWRHNSGLAESDSKGNTMVLWAEDDRLLSSRYEVGTGWEPPELVSEEDGTLGGVDFAMAPSGDAVAAWRSCPRADSLGDCAILAVGYDPEHGWGLPERINSGGWGSTFYYGEAHGPRIVLNEAGDALVVWTEQSALDEDKHQRLWMNRLVVEREYWVPDEIGWGTPTPITEDARWVSIRDLSMDSSGQAVAVWSQQGGNESVLYASQFIPPQEWETPTLISSEYTGGPTQVITNTKGDILLTWTEWDPAAVPYDNFRPLRLLASRFVPSVGWEPASLIWRFDAVSTYRPTYPDYAAALDPDGRALIVWRGYSTTSGGTPIYASRFVPGAGWGARELVEQGSDQGGFPGSPYPAFDSEGNPLVVWPTEIKPYRNRDTVIFMSRFVSAEVLLQEGLDDANLRLAAFENRLLFLAGLGLVLLAVTSTLSLLYGGLRRRLADPTETWNGSDRPREPEPRKEPKSRAGEQGWARRVGDGLRLRTAKAIAIVPVGRSLLLVGSALLLVGLFLPSFTVSYGISAFAHPYLPPGEYNGPATIHKLGYFAGGWDHFPRGAWYAMALFGWLILVAVFGVTSVLVARRFSWIGVSGIFVLVLLAIQMSRAASGDPFASVASPSVGFAFGFGLAVTGAALIETGARVKTPAAGLTSIPTPLPLGILLIGLGTASIVGSLALSSAVHQQMNLIIGLGIGIPSTVGGALLVTSFRKARLRSGVLLMALGFVSVVAGFFAWIFSFRIGVILPVIDAIAVAWTFGVVMFAVGLLLLARPSMASGPVRPSASP